MHNSLNGLEKYNNYSMIGSVVIRISYDKNILLKKDYKNARLDHGHTTVCSVLLYCFLFQVMVKELSSMKFVGCLRIGVTTLSPERVCEWKKWSTDNDASGNSIALDRTDDGKLCVCSKGEVGLYME